MIATILRIMIAQGYYIMGTSKEVETSFSRDVVVDMQTFHHCFSCCCFYFLLGGVHTHTYIYTYIHYHWIYIHIHINKTNDTLIISICKCFLMFFDNISTFTTATLATLMGWSCCENCQRQHSGKLGSFLRGWAFMVPKHQPG